MAQKSNRVRTMRIYRRFYNMIERDEKRIEVRVAYPSMRNIRAGDVINVSCDRIVTRVASYATFKEMMDSEDPTKINPHKSAVEQLDEIRQIFPPHKERIGVLVFEFLPLREVQR